ncbi:MAG: VOC family protein [Pseudomonadota bacterium]
MNQGAIIDALDHVVLICSDIEAGVADYSALFGRAPEPGIQSTGGASVARFQFQNTALEIMAPQGAGPMADRVNAALKASGPALTSLAFRCDDLMAAHHALTRRGLSPGDVSGAEAGRSFRCEDAACAGIKTFVLGGDGGPAARAPHALEVAQLDHLVIATPNPDRAAAHYGARLGLRLALDRTAPQWKTRFLFFRVGGLTLEVIHRIDEDTRPEEDDRIWGLGWKTGDLAASHARLTANGVDVSPIREGRKPGTEVFTVRSSTLGIPTLFIGQSPG